jgi:hypothetical protein
MERLIKEEIVQPLDFSDLDYCVECIKGKFIMHIKKNGAIHSSGVLEIIHSDICGPLMLQRWMVIIHSLLSPMISPSMVIFISYMNNLST